MDFPVNKYGPCANSSWVMLIKSKYAKHQGKGTDKTKGKFINQHLLNTSEYALRAVRNNLCFQYLATQNIDKLINVECLDLG